MDDLADLFSNAVRSLDDLIAHEGDLVDVIGTYVEVDVRQNPEPPAVHAGHAAIELQDGTQVLLYPPWDDSAARSVEEREQFRGVKVVVTGSAGRSAPPDPMGGASLEAPCFALVAGVVPYELYADALAMIEDEKKG